MGGVIALLVMVSIVSEGLSGVKPLASLDASGALDGLASLVHLSLLGDALTVGRFRNATVGTDGGSFSFRLKIELIKDSLRHSIPLVLVIPKKGNHDELDGCPSSENPREGAVSHPACQIQHADGDPIGGDTDEESEDEDGDGVDSHVLHHPSQDSWRDTASQVGSGASYWIS